MVWSIELGTGNIQGQHLHFMFFARNNNATPDDTNLDMSLNGDSSENFTGIVYDPKSTLTLNGNGGAGSNGPPWIEGQIVAWDGTFSGNSTVDVVYRPCAPGSPPCGNGPGTALVQ